MTPSGRNCHVARLQGRHRRCDEARRYGLRQAAINALSDDQLQRVLLLGRRCRHEGPDSLSAAETEELDSLVGPIMSLYEPDDELP